MNKRKIVAGIITFTILEGFIFGVSAFAPAGTKLLTAFAANAMIAFCIGAALGFVRLWDWAME